MPLLDFQSTPTRGGIFDGKGGWFSFGDMRGCGFDSLRFAAKVVGFEIIPYFPKWRGLNGDELPW